MSGVNVPVCGQPHLSCPRIERAENIVVVDLIWQGTGDELFTGSDTTANAIRGNARQGRKESGLSMRSLQTCASPCNAWISFVEETRSAVPSARRLLFSA